MPENYTPVATTGTWTEEEIRHQPQALIRSLTNIDARYVPRSITSLNRYCAKRICG